jgi:hypothetical protein
MFLITNVLVNKLVNSDLYTKTKAYKLAKEYRDAYKLSIDSPIDIIKFCLYHEIDSEAIVKTLKDTKTLKP